MTLYSNEVREFIRSRNWPKAVSWEIAEKFEPEPHLNLIFFRDNWLTLSVDDQLHVVSIVREIMEKMWGDGIPTYVAKMERAHG